jgi:hypothetical protein
MSKNRIAWAKRVAGWQASGLSCKKYAARIGVNHHTLSYWKYKLARKAEAERKVAPSFIEVSSTMVAGSGAIEIVAIGGDVVRVPVGFDRATLRQVLDVLAEPR